MADVTIGDIATTETDLGNVAFVEGERGDGSPVKIPGSLFSSSGGYFDLTPPEIADFGTVIKTTGLTDSSTDAAEGYALLKITKGSDWANDEGMARLTATGGSTFTKEIGFLVPPTYSTFITFGLMIRDSATTKATIYGTSSRNSATMVMQYAKQSVVSSAGATWTHASDIAATGSIFTSPVFIRAVADGTNIVVDWSPDKQNYFRILSETLATHLATPDQIGPAIFLRNASTNAPSIPLRRSLTMPIVHWA